MRRRALQILEVREQVLLPRWLTRALEETSHEGQ